MAIETMTEGLSDRTPKSNRLLSQFLLMQKTLKCLCDPSVAKDDGNGMHLKPAEQTAEEEAGGGLSLIHI